MQMLLGRKPNIGSKNSLSTPFVEHSPQLVLTPDQGAAVKEGRQTRPVLVGDGAAPMLHTGLALSTSASGSTSRAAH